MVGEYEPRFHCINCHIALFNAIKSYYEKKLLAKLSGSKLSVNSSAVGSTE